MRRTVLRGADRGRSAEDSSVKPVRTEPVAAGTTAPVSAAMSTPCGGCVSAETSELSVQGPWPVASVAKRESDEEVRGADAW
jgi:hypothetical protein